MNVDIIFVWFPPDVVPCSGDLPDMQIPRAGQDYPVDRDRLPKGLIMFDYGRLNSPNRVPTNKTWPDWS